jgi:hypothetical protein
MRIDLVLVFLGFALVVLAQQAPAPSPGAAAAPAAQEAPKGSGLRLRTRLMHDGASLTVNDAVLRHRGESVDVTERYQRLSDADRAALLEFLRSL